MMRLKLMFEWGGGAIWPDDDASYARFTGGPVEDDLPLSDETRKRLEELGVWHDTALNWDYPPDPGPWPEEEYARFDAAVEALLPTLRRELAPEYEIQYKRLV